MLQKEKEKESLLVRVKTIDGNIHSLDMPSSADLKLLRDRILDLMGIPIQRQRLILRGKPLSEDSTPLSSLGLDDQSLIYLIANLAQHPQMSESSGTQAKLSVVRKRHQEYARHRLAQQRVNGFPVNQLFSAEVVYQNLQTVKQLLHIVLTDQHADSVPFNYQFRKLKVGQWLDVKDTEGQWLQGQVVDHKTNLVLIYFNGLSCRWNQWIPINSHRLAPFRAHTVQPLQSALLSPTPLNQPRIKRQQRIKSLQLLQDMHEVLLSLSSMLQKLRNETQTRKANQNSIDQLQRKQVVEQEQQKFQENKEQMRDDLMSNKCENDNLSNKSMKKQIEEGFMDTVSMKSFTSRKSQGISLDYDTSSVKSMKSLKSDLSKFTVHGPQHFNQTLQENIPEEQDSQMNQSYQQSFKTEQTVPNQASLTKRGKLLCSQLAPLFDRLGRSMIDMAPHLAMLGLKHQQQGMLSQLNMSTMTNQGSLSSHMAMQLIGGQSPQEEMACYQFQIPVMLSPAQVNAINNIIRQSDSTIN